MNEIQINHPNGKITVDMETMVAEMPLVKYRKWAKLFMQYGKCEDIYRFMSFLRKRIRENAEETRALEARVNGLGCAINKVVCAGLPTRKIRGELRQTKAELSKHTTRHKRYRTMLDAILGAQT